MRTVKISLTAIVITAMIFFVIRSFVTPDKVPETKQVENPFSGRINEILQEISALQLKPENEFCNDYYNEVAYHIEDYYKDSKLGKSSLENDQWKDNLSKQLYAAYTDKFIKQAYYVFSRTDWKNEDLGFIRSEYRTLKSSSLLERNSPIDSRFNEIRAIFSKYDEITAFISSCIDFKFSNTSLDMHFPLDEVSSKIDRAASYRSSSLENSYVNNCTRLHNGLIEIPQVLFKAHCDYLEEKIDYWSGAYAYYGSQRTYRDSLWVPLNNEIETLDNAIYNIIDFSSEYNRLKRKLVEEGTDAYNFFNSK